MVTKFITNRISVNLDNSRQIWDNGEKGDKKISLWVEGDTSDNQGNWRLWLETNADPVTGDDAITDALVANGVDVDAARNAVEEGRFGGL